MQVLIKTMVNFLYLRAKAVNEGGLSMLFTWLVSNWVFIPFWYYVGTLEQTPSFTLAELLLGFPIISLIIFPIGIIQFGLYSLVLSILHHLLNKPHIIAD